MRVQRVASIDSWLTRLPSKAPIRDSQQTRLATEPPNRDLLLKTGDCGRSKPDSKRATFGLGVTQREPWPTERNSEPPIHDSKRASHDRNLPRPDLEWKARGS
jgi:hypothetical protein